MPLLLIVFLIAVVAILGEKGSYWKLIGIVLFFLIVGCNGLFIASM